MDLPPASSSVQDLLVHGGVALFDSSGLLTDCSDDFARALGQPPEELIGRAHDELLLPAGSALPCVVRQAQETRQLAVQPLSLGGRLFQATAQPLQARGGCPSAVSVTLFALGGRQQQLAAEREQFRALADGLPQIIWTARPDGSIEYLNRRCYEFLGLTPGSGAFDIWRHLVHPEDMPEVHRRWSQSLATGEPYEAECRYRRHDGAWRWFLCRAFPLREAEGHIHTWLGTSTDIDDQKRAARAQSFLAEASTLLTSSLVFEEIARNLARLAVPQLADWCAVEVLQADGSLQRIAVAHADPAKAQLARSLESFSATVPKALGGEGHSLHEGRLQLIESISDELLVRIAADEHQLEQLRGMGLRSLLRVPLVVRGRLLGSIALLQAESGRRFSREDVLLAEELARRAALGLDNARLYQESQAVAERAERERHEAEQARAAIDTIFDAVPVGIALLDRESRYRRLNRTLSVMNGISIEAHLGHTPSEVFPDLDRRIESVVQRALASGETTDLESTGRTQSSGEEHTWLARYAPVRTSDGRTLGLAVVVLDITERKRAEAERERLIAALERSNRELDQFAYVASHDLKAPLRGIANLSQWIEDDLQEVMTDETREQMRLLRGRVHRLEALINGILDYSRAGRVHSRPERVEVGKLLADCIELLAPPPGACVKLEPGMPTLHTERVLLQQVFLNLLGNAFKYAQRSDLQVRVGVREAEDCWEFCVADNGPGIAPEFQARIWGLFQRLQARDAVEGTGIGLSVVKKSVEARGGRAWVESSPGQGATFFFTWPKIAPEQEG